MRNTPSGEGVPMHVHTEVALVNVGRSIVFALLAVAGMVGHVATESLWWGIWFVWCLAVSMYCLPGQFKVVKKDGA